MSGLNANTKLLIHFNGNDGATTYTAETGQTVNFVGTAQLDTAVKKFGSAALLLDGNSDNINVSHDNALDLLADKTTYRTYDFWFYPTDLTANHRIIGMRKDSGNYWILFSNTSGQLTLVTATGGSARISAVSTTALNLNQWNWISLVKTNDATPKWGVYQGGTQVIYAADANLTVLTQALEFGTVTATFYTAGSLEELRCQNDNLIGASPNVGLTDTITVPTAEYSVASTLNLRCLMGVGS